jgi:quercetin dioxygenase-like cupin family protein
LRLAALFLLLSTAFAQDLVSIAPNSVKIEYEDAQVRVVRLKINPQQILPMHERPARVVIPLTVNDVELTAADGTRRTINVPPGQIAWSGPTKRSVKNFDVPVENIIVEIKGVADPAKPVAQSSLADDPRALVESHHHWLFENQYVRVYDVRIPAGEMTEFHRHAYNTVSIQLSDGLTSAQKQGAGWGKSEASKAGTVDFLADAGKARIHRVRNDGKSEYHVVLVQLKDSPRAAE